MSEILFQVASAQLDRAAVDDAAAALEQAVLVADQIGSTRLAGSSI